MSRDGDGSLRDSMPGIAAWIDALREAFGVAEINAQIRLGLKGERIFYASENGIEIGMRAPPGVRVSEGGVSAQDPSAGEIFDRGTAGGRRGAASMAATKGRRRGNAGR